MLIRELTRDDTDAAAQLWAEAGLTRPWNPPAADLARAVEGDTSTVLGAFEGGAGECAALTGTAMVGHDGHRGWIYYLAVAEEHRGTGLGRQLMHAAEEWLRERGTVKVQLMVRSGHEAVLDFYDHLGYENAGVQVLAKWLTPEE